MQTVPVQLDVFGLFILLGAFQGFLLAAIFLVSRSERPLYIRLLGWMLLTFSILIGDIFLCYSGYMQYIVTLNDASEPLNFTFGPLIYLTIRARLNHRIDKNEWFHFSVAVFFFFYILQNTIQPDSYKFHSYLQAYHPEFPPVPYQVWWHPDPLHLRWIINELTILHILIYVVLSVAFVIQRFRQEGLGFWSTENQMVTWVRTQTIVSVLIIIIVIITKLTFKRDLGDHLIGVAIASFIYLISLDTLRSSLILQPQPAIKQRKSNLREEDRQLIGERLVKIMTIEKPWISPDFSLRELAERTGTTTHQMSEYINAELEKTFYEMIADYRIDEAKQILSNPVSDFLRIEDVAEKTGYLSKSTFNSAFKKRTGLTPAEFRKQLTQKI